MSEKTPDLRQEKFIKMTTQPVEKLVLRLSVPTIASMLVTAAYNLADTYFVSCWVVPSNMTEQTIGWTVSASLLAMARQGLFLIPLVLILPNRFGVTGLELCQPVSDILALLLAVPLQIRVLRHLKQEVPNEAADQ